MNMHLCYRCICFLWTDTCKLINMHLCYWYSCLVGFDEHVAYMYKICRCILLRACALWMHATVMFMQLLYLASALLLSVLSVVILLVLEPSVLHHEAAPQRLQMAQWRLLGGLLDSWDARTCRRSHPLLVCHRITTADTFIFCLPCIRSQPCGN